MAVASDFQLQQFLRLPGQHLIRQPLESFAEHANPPRSRARAPQMQIAQPAPPPAVTHSAARITKIESSPPLRLQPLCPRPPGSVRQQRSDFAIIPFVPVTERSFEKLLRLAQHR